MKTMRMTTMAILAVGMAALPGRAQQLERGSRTGDAERSGKLADAAKERREKLEAQKNEMEARKAEWEAKRTEAEKERAAREERRAELEKKRAEAGNKPADSVAPRAEIEKRRAEWEARRAELEKERAAWEAKKTEHAGKRVEAEARRKEMEAKRAEEKARMEAERERRSGKAGDLVDQRQENQARRIEHGVRRGFLTPEETAALRGQQKAIADLEETFKADGRLTRTEFATLRDMLNTASRMIWAEKHDTDGKQMPVYRLGKNVFALDSLTAKLSDPDLSRSEGRALLADFRRLLNLRDRLANEELSEEQRAQLQESYDALLNTYFRLG